MDLQDYQETVNNLLSLALTDPEKIVFGPLHEEGYFEDRRTQKEVCCLKLAQLSQEIRRILWSNPFQEDALTIARQADDFVCGQRLPRFEAGYQDCSGYFPAID